MKVLHIVHSFPPEYKGGTETYVMNLALRQHRTGCEVHVLCGSTREGKRVLRQKERLGPIRVLRLFKQAADGPYKAVPNYPRLSKEIRDELRRLNPDVVHVHHWHHLTDDLVRMAAADRFPVVLTLHDFFSVCPLFFRIRPDAREICPNTQAVEACTDCIARTYSVPAGALSRDLELRRKRFGEEVRAASHVYTFSMAVAQFYMGIPWFPPVRIHVSPIGLMQPLRRAPVKENNRPLRVVSWGGQIEVKGTHLLLEAAASPRLKGRIELHVFGRILEDAYQARLERLASRCGATLHGSFSEPEKESLGRRFDLAVFPTQAFETYSIVIDEALGMGLPVVATSPGAQSERVGGAGRIVPSGDVGALVDAIEAFLDPTIRRQATEAAARIRVGTMDGHWARLRKVYQGLKGRRQPRKFPPPLIAPPLGRGAGRAFPGKEKE
jgi:glycosyltransferase involved in cell wall biosynthesis